VSDSPLAATAQRFDVPPLLTLLPPPPTSTDGLAELMLAIRSGDRDAFVDFYDATSRLIFSVVVRILFNRCSAEDVTREAYLEMWRTAWTYDPATDTALEWANTIARRRAVEQIRQEKNLS
jgi:RNA polymerase sigma-70 factor (ECF subfamily)